MAKVSKRPLYDMLDGIRYASMFSSRCLREVLDYTPRQDDVFICTYPKCGTTWMQHIALYIFRKGRELEDHNDFLTLCPFVDMTGQQSIDRMPRPGAFKSHLPYGRLPKSPNAKYIFVAREPKDCCVSFYNHTQQMPGYDFFDGTFDDFFELFMAGEVEFNDYFDHLFSWYPHRRDPNVFYTTYETMKRDHRGVVVRLAKFLGDEYAEAIERDNAVLGNILRFSSFEYMKKHFNAYDFKDQAAYQAIMDDPDTFEGSKYVLEFINSLPVPDVLPKHEFIRKGVVGDWKNYFSEEQAQRLNRKFFERTRDTEIQQWYPLI